MLSICDMLWEKTTAVKERRKMKHKWLNKIVFVLASGVMLLLKPGSLLRSNCLACLDAWEIPARNRPTNHLLYDCSTQFKTNVRSIGNRCRKFLQEINESSWAIPFQQQISLKNRRVFVVVLLQVIMESWLTRRKSLWNRVAVAIISNYIQFFRSYVNKSV